MPSALVWGALDHSAEATKESVVRTLALRRRQRDARFWARLARRWQWCGLASWFLRGRLESGVRAFEEASAQQRDALAAAPRPALTGPRPSAPIDRLAANAWYEGSLSLHVVCRARSIRYLHVLQPLPASGSPMPPSALEQLRERAAQLERQGVPFLDASEELESERFADPTRLDSEGARELARLIAAALAEAG